MAIIDTKLVTTWLDIVPQYLNFAVRFPRNPRRAVESFSGKSEVHSDAFSLALGGIALAYLFVIVIRPDHLASDPSRAVQWLRTVPIEVVPPAVLLGVCVFAIAVHVLAKLFEAASRRRDTGSWDPHLSGTVEDTVNAALAFSAAFIPIGTLAICVATSRTAAALGLALAALIIAYLPWSIAACHVETRWSQAFLAFSGAVVVGVLLIMLGGEALTRLT